MRSFKNLLFLITLSLLVSCSSTIVKYYFQPVSSTDQNFEVLSDLYARYNYSITTGQFKIRLDPDSERFGFSISNYSADTLSIVWDSIKVIDKSNNKTIGNFRPTDQSKSNLSLLGDRAVSKTNILPGKTFSDELNTNKLFNTKSSSNSTLAEEVKQNVGKIIELKLFLTDKINSYSFQLPFKVNNFQIRNNN